MVFIIAEIGINHNGSTKIAKKLIDSAVLAGCNAVKFQKRTVEKVYSKEVLDSQRESPWGKTTREQKLGLEFSYKQYEIINNYCKKKKIPWFVSCWDVESQINMRKFKTKYNIPFLFLSDRKKVVSKQYGTKGFLFPSRKTFVIDKNGKLMNIFNNVDVHTHAAEILKLFSKKN